MGYKSINEHPLKSLALLPRFIVSQSLTSASTFKNNNLIPLTLNLKISPSSSNSIPPLKSDICHQSVYELVHSEDREELLQQLKWNSMIPQSSPTSTSNLVNGSSNTTTSDNVSASASATAASSNSAPVPAVDRSGQVGVAERGKSASQMSLQEILASRKYPPNK